MRALIVSRTRGGSGDKRCIGGITRVEDGAGGFRYESIRLMKPRSHKGFWPNDAPYRIGDVWDLELEDPPYVEPPHVEDKLVRGGQRVSRLDGRSLEHRLLQIVPNMSPGCYWEGETKELFGGMLETSDSGKGYVTREGITETSTGFWIPDSELVLDRSEYGRAEYRYERKRSANRLRRSGITHLKYIGEPEPVELIPRETLVRVSLARWWTGNNRREACWLMLSGWYSHRS